MKPVTRRRGAALTGTRWTWAGGAALALVGATFALVLSVHLRAEDTAHRLASLLELREGMRVADVGAGSGEIAATLATYLGAEGRMYATEVSADRLSELRRRAAAAEPQNFVVLEAGDRESRLPEGCCDVVLMRRVYHHLTHPETYMASLARALVPSGRLVIIDFEPRWRGHGTTRGSLVEAIEAAGFQVERNEADWAGRDYLILARRGS